MRNCLLEGSYTTIIIIASIIYTKLETVSNISVFYMNIKTDQFFFFLNSSISKDFTTTYLYLIQAPRFFSFAPIPIVEFLLHIKLFIFHQNYKIGNTVLPEFQLIYIPEINVGINCFPLNQIMKNPYFPDKRR